LKASIASARVRSAPALSPLAFCAKVCGTDPAVYAVCESLAAPVASR
jgi:hypothetical protein